MAILQWIWDNIFCNAGVFLALLIVIGQLLSKKTFLDSVVGGIKGYIGYVVFGIATGGLGDTFRPILFSLKERFSLDVAINDSYYGLAAMEQKFNDLGGNMGLSGVVMGLGILILIVLALGRKVTKVRTLNIQGHSLAYEGMRCLMLVFCLYPFAPTGLVIVLAAGYMAIHMAATANLSVEPCQDLTDGANMAIDHCQVFGDRLAWEIGKKIETRSIKKTGKKPVSFDTLKLPGWLSLFNDVYVSCFIVMFLFFGVIMMALGRTSLMAIDPELTESTSLLMYIFATAGKFPMYLVILFTGLRMFVAEIMVAFDGLNKKALHGVIPAIDIAAFFGFAGNPNVITMGFLVGTVVMICCTVIGVIFNMPFVVMMGFTQMMFDNAPVAMFGHQHGGVKGLFIGAIICGVVDTFLGGLAGLLLGYMPYNGFAFQFDYAVEFTLFGPIVNTGIIGFVIFLLVLLAIPQIQYALTKDKEGYYLVASDYQEYKARLADKK